MKRYSTATTSTFPATASQTGLAEVPQDWLEVAPASPPAWRHTLILTGTLNSGSMLELEEEIECLYQEGVTSLVLDLRRLDALESVGARAVGSLSALYRRRGLDVEVIGGAGETLRASVAGGPGVSMPEAMDTVSPRFYERSSQRLLSARSTTTIKEL